ncbi:462_t:CDS:2 [Ambispora gerdemannii]|uniref:462_t:CDS:1 n=1 Tax=Ambispora gerdemannii TaxID=144530 RepID=A0A9N9ATS2_9GLOM|nr:462_t:CDS:2 [Ambispora gerdemannii]
MLASRVSCVGKISARIRDTQLRGPITDRSKNYEFASIVVLRNLRSAFAYDFVENHRIIRSAIENFSSSPHTHIYQDTKHTIQNPATNKTTIRWKIKHVCISYVCWNNPNKQHIFTFQVSFRGKLHSIEQWAADSSVRGLKEHMEEVTGVPADLQKLIYHGILKDDSTLRNSNLKSGARITMIGSSQAEVQTIRDADAKMSHKPRKSKYAINPYKDIKSSSTHSMTQYKFHQIQVLEHLPFPEKARQILERLSEDRGIRAIMERHKFSVGVLAELSPAEKDLLGYNQNKGQIITLRLRTDDLEGFRHYPAIRRVLLHELAHCVWTGHDENFHRLNRQLNKEVVELDWTQSAGHKIDHHEYYQPLDEEDSIDAAGYVGGTFRLGGDAERMKESPRREILAQAATLRLTKEEEELDKGCGLDKFLRDPKILSFCSERQRSDNLILITEIQRKRLVATITEVVIKHIFVVVETITFRLLI